MGTINESSMDALFNGLTQTPTPPEEKESKEPLQEHPKQTQENEEEPIPQVKQSQHSPVVQKRFKPSKKQLKEGFLVRLGKENLDKTRIIAFTNGIPISDVIDYALSDFIERYEKKNGRIKTKGRKVSVTELL